MLQLHQYLFSFLRIIEYLNVLTHTNIKPGVMSAIYRYLLYPECRQEFPCGAIVTVCKGRLAFNNRDKRFIFAVRFK